MNTELYMELISQGVDEATARKFAENSGASEGNDGLPFEVIKINYDKEDILSDVGVKKGEFIAGWQIDKKNFAVTKEGKVFKQPLEFFVIGMGFQKSAYDPQKGGYKYITPIFSNAFEAKKVIELKTGKPVGELEEEIGEKLKFNAILLLAVKEGKEYNPYLMYLRGTNYGEFNKQLENEGIKLGDVTLKYKFKVKTTKVPTKAGIPAWIMKIEELGAFTDFMKYKDMAVEAINKFDEWKLNSQTLDTPSTSVDNSDNVTTNDEVETEFED